MIQYLSARSIVFTGLVVLMVLASVDQANAQTPILLDTWVAESYPSGGFGDAVWTVADDKLSVFQSVNAQPTLFYSDFSAAITIIEGKVMVETTGDDNYIGFALGFQPGDASNASSLSE